MLQDSKLGKLTVDLQANTSGLRKGMAQARGVLASGVKGMSSALSSLKLPALALGALLGVGLVRAFSSFVATSKRLAVLENTFKKLNKSAKYAFKDMELGMLSLAKVTGVSTSDQAGALQQLMNQLSGLMSPQDMQSILLPIALDWAAASGKDAKEAAKDIADAFLGELPEDFKVVKIKYEAETGKKFDDLTNGEKWKLVYDYLKQFEGSAEAAGNTLGGSFTKMKVALQEVFDAIVGSTSFEPLIGLFQMLSDKLFDFAERIKKGDIPPSLLELQDALTKLWDKLSKIDWEKTFKWLGDNWDKIFGALKGIAIGIAGFSIADKVTPAINGLGGAFNGLLSFIGGLIGGGLLERFGKDMYKWIFEAWQSSSAKGAPAAVTGIQSVFARFFGELSKGNGIFAAFGGGFQALATVLGVSAGALGAILATVAASIALFVIAWKGNWDGIREKTAEAWNGVKDTFINVWETSIKPIIDSIAEKWNKLVESLKAFGITLPEFKDIFKFAFETIKTIVGSTFTFIIDSLAFVAKTIGNVIGIIIEAVGLLFTPFDLLKAVVKTLVLVFTGQFDKIGAVWGDFIKDITGHISKIIGYFGNFVGDIIQWGANFISAILAPFTHAIKGMDGFRQNLRDWAANINKAIHEWTSELIAKFTEWVAGMLKKLTELLVGFGQWGFDLLKKFGEFLKSIGQWILDVLIKFGEFVVGLGNKTTEILTNFGQWILDIGKKFVEFLMSIGKFIFDVLKAVGQFVADITIGLGKLAIEFAKGFADILVKFGQWIVDIGKKFAEFIVSIGQFFFDVIKGFGQWIVDIAAKGVEFIKELGSLPAKALEKLGELVVSLGKGFYNVMVGIGQWVVDVGIKIGEFLGFFIELPGKIIDGLGNIGSAIGEKLGGAVEAVREGVSNCVQAVKNFFWDMADAGKGLIGAFWDGVKEKWDSMMGWIKDKLQLLRDLLPGSDAKTGPLSTLTKAGRGLITAMQSGAEGKMDGFINSVRGFAGDVAGSMPTGNGFDMYSTPGYVGAGNGGITIQINGGTFASDRAMKDLVTEIDKQLGQRRK